MSRFQIIEQVLDRNSGTTKYRFATLNVGRYSNKRGHETKIQDVSFDCANFIGLSIFPNSAKFATRRIYFEVCDFIYCLKATNIFCYNKTAHCCINNYSPHCASSSSPAFCKASA